jgi:hypothetical protein
LAVEQEVIEPEDVKVNPEAFRCIGEEVTEMLDYRPARFFRHQIIRRKFVRREQPELAPIIAPLPDSRSNVAWLHLDCWPKSSSANIAISCPSTPRNGFTGTGIKSGCRAKAWPAGSN